MLSHLDATTIPSAAAKIGEPVMSVLRLPGFVAGKTSTPS
jgi:hypothetical protein